MNGKIQEETLERMEKIRGSGPIRRGLDKAINECLDRLEDGTCKDTIEEKIENSRKIDCLNDDCKKELTQNAS